MQSRAIDNQSVNLVPREKDVEGGCKSEKLRWRTDF